MELTLSRSLQQTPNSPSKASSICIGFPTTPTKKNKKPKKKKQKNPKGKSSLTPNSDLSLYKISTKPNFSTNPNPLRVRDI
jgi:hypothetical protein